MRLAEQMRSAVRNHARQAGRELFKAVRADALRQPEEVERALIQQAYHRGLARGFHVSLRWLLEG